MIEEIRIKSLRPWRTIATNIPTTQVMREIEKTGLGTREENQIHGRASWLVETAMKLAAANGPDGGGCGDGDALDLVILTPAELGFDKPVHIGVLSDADFCSAWSWDNLEGCEIRPCPPLTGLYLRRQYQDQEPGEAIWTSMVSLPDEKGIPTVLVVWMNPEGRKWLIARWARPSQDLLPPHSKVAFRLVRLDTVAE